jgi:hypothetical protein
MSSAAPMPPEDKPEVQPTKIEWTSVSKAIINVLTLIVAIGTPLLSYTTGVLPEKYALVISAVVGISGSVLHYITPNTTTNPVVAQTQSVRLVSGN